MTKDEMLQHCLTVIHSQIQALEYDLSHEDGKQWDAALWQAQQESQNERLAFLRDLYHEVSFWHKTDATLLQPLIPSLESD
jgi:hypothetical protein